MYILFIYIVFSVHRVTFRFGMSYACTRVRHKCNKPKIDVQKKTIASKLYYTNNHQHEPSIVNQSYVNFCFTVDTVLHLSALIHIRNLLFSNSKTVFKVTYINFFFFNLPNSSIHVGLKMSYPF